MRLLSPRELADALGVSESSLKRWVDAGKLTATRTTGGHRKIALPEALRFIRETSAPIARPELLGMSDVAAVQANVHDDDAFRHYLLEGDVVAARGWLRARYLAGESIAALCDGPVRAAMYQIGGLWAHQPEGIFLEHRATDTCLQALAPLRATFDPAPKAPLAIGGAPEDDPYILPTFMVATVLASVGMRAVNLGPFTPVAALAHAVVRDTPVLVWLSASVPVSPARIKELGHWIGTLSSAVSVVVGGRRGYELASAHPRARLVDSMAELAALADFPRNRATRRRPAV